MTTDVTRYRKLYTRLWRHKVFLGLSRDDKLLVAYVLTGPQTNRIGYFAFSPGQAAEDLGFQAGRTFTLRLRQVCAAFDWAYDDAARTLLVTSWWDWNKPENRNVLAGALKDLAEVPQSGLDARFAEGVSRLISKFGPMVPEKVAARLGLITPAAIVEPSPEPSPEPLAKPSPEPLPKPSPEPCRDGSPIQEQEQEQDPRQRTAAAPPPPTPSVAEEPRRGPAVAVPFPVIASLVRSLLAEGGDWTYPGAEADLREEIKTRCAKHRIAYDAVTVAKAVDSERHKAAHGFRRVGA